ncbi:hypothetical protein [Sphingosinicella terrae]|jgi:hypothetical protein|uniref:hypothetical protein n=1 Tax=Sphingosinicella terrae TaxID=2172047 RepID=UPI000E0D0125|nr:hypothetical protein [Sphingosinicella terrae]
MSSHAFVLTIIFFVVGLPVVLGIGSDIFKRWLKHKEKQLDHAAHLAADKAASQAVQIERLEQRIRVLERIVTDRSNHLAAEIDALPEPTREQPKLAN